MIICQTIIFIHFLLSFILQHQEKKIAFTIQTHKDQTHKTIHYIQDAQSASSGNKHITNARKAARPELQDKPPSEMMLQIVEGVIHTRALSHPLAELPLINILW